MDTSGKDVTIEFAMVNATVNLYDVWEVFGDMDMDGVLDMDLNGDGMVDENDILTFCQGPLPFQQLATSVPWPFTAQIEILPAGETTSTVITDNAAAFNEFANLTPYDATLLLGQTPNNPGGFGPEFVFINPRRVSGGNRDVLEGVAGSCLGAPSLGDARVSTDNLPLTLTLNRGDTVIVRARRGNLPPQGLNVLSVPQLSSTVLVDGQVASVDGTTVTATTAGSPLSYSFTVR